MLMTYLYGRLVTECRSCADAHPWTFLTFLVFSAIGANALLRAILALVRQGRRPRA